MLHMFDRNFLFFTVTLMGASASVALGSDLVFNRDIRPILSENCFACHGTDAKKRKGDLRLDEEAGAKAALEEGRVAIKSGDPAGSELWKRINETDPDEVMPPPKTHKTLTSEQKETLKLWISQGAKYQKHWAFEPLVKPTLPEIRNPQSAIRNPIDTFIMARLAQEGLKFSPLKLLLSVVKNNPSIVFSSFFIKKLHLILLKS